ncbi:MAG: prolyl oligopeptidase family serine peptidase, partial [Desulfobacterales bacterium]|nr:prolyl oligopeptidase family serine peptidase [Desulfobacterales bacterium]
FDTHKFEERYLDSMVGPLPAAAARYHDWSPMYHFANLRDPLAVFQGKEDKVVPPEQAEEIVKALRQNGVAHIYRLYDGEGHGWRKTETIIDCLQQTERFLQQQVLFSA